MKKSSYRRNWSRRSVHSLSLSRMLSSRDPFQKRRLELVRKTKKQEQNKKHSEKRKTASYLVMTRRWLRGWLRKGKMDFASFAIQPTTKAAPRSSPSFAKINILTIKNAIGNSRR